MIEKIAPAFQGEHNVPIVFSSNQEFAPVLAVMLQSIIAHATQGNTYDVVILTQDIDSAYGERLRSMLEGYDNFSLRIVDVSKYFSQYTLYVANRPDITVETYFRLVIPELMEGYEKVLYLDGDMIANADVAELLEVELGGALLAAAYDCDSIGCYYKPVKDLKEYRDEVLKLQYPDQYFCAGVLVMDLRQFRAAYSAKELLEFAASYEWRQHDQDVLNVIGQGRTKLLSPAWDLLRDAGNSQYMPGDLYSEFLRSEREPKIIHYGGKRKPWIYFDVERGEYFWRYAGMTPLYREILSMVGDANEKRYEAYLGSGTSILGEDQMKEAVLEQFAKGKIGFRYIWRYFKAWLGFKMHKG